MTDRERLDYALASCEQLRAALAASQEEVERLAKRLEVRLEAGKLCDKMSQGDMRSLVDEVNTERTRAEAAESALAAAQAEIERLRAIINAAMEWAEIYAPIQGVNMYRSARARELRAILDGSGEGE